MNPLRLLFPYLVLTLTPLAIGAPDEPVLPPLAPELTALNPEPLLPASAPDFKFYDNNKAAAPSTLVMQSSHGPGLAFHAEVAARGKNSYDVEVKIKTSVPVKKGDIVLARFFARAPVARQESGEGALGFSFARGVSPYEKSVSLAVAPGPEWKLYEIPFTVGTDFAAGEAVVALTLADLVQTVEISGLELFDFGTRARLEQLPKTQFTYQGRAADAPWRAAALQRIEEIRTAPLTIHVTNAAGQPLAGARVEAQLVQSDFVWGTSVNDELIVADTPQAERYRQTLLEFFNTAVIENGLKWKTWVAGPKRQAVAVQALDWIHQKGLRHKGHNLVWPGWKFSPAGLGDLPDPAQDLPKLITARITEMIGVTKGRSFAWDVVNEPVHERDFFQHIPETAMADWYKLAHSLDPSLQLFINEYSMLNGALSPGMIARFTALIETLRQAGAPIGGIGIQSHIGNIPRPPVLVLSDLELLAREGLPLQITEFDFNTTDEQLQADYTRDFLIACYSQPAVTGFIMWGFWQGAHWKPEAAMFRRDWSEKPNAAVWREWVLGKWKTHLDTNTPANGTASGRGHLGRYHVTVTDHGAVQQQDFTLPHAGTEVTVKFP